MITMSVSYNGALYWLPGVYLKISGFAKKPLVSKRNQIRHGIQFTNNLPDFSKIESEIKVINTRLAGTPTGAVRRGRCPHRPQSGGHAIIWDAPIRN